MNPPQTLLLFAIIAALLPTALAQDATSATDPASKPPTTEELEAKFKATLANVTFSGRWCLIQDGKMGPEREDKYTIQGATKVGGDRWIIHARVQYGQQDFIAPIPVQVKWAGDTPVIIVDNLAMPGGTNRYSARVLVYDQSYAGRWSGGSRGGLLNGVITRQSE
jgi:hypothetical protein